MKENSTSVYQLVQAIKANGLNAFNSKLAVEKEFYSPSKLGFEYIEPPLSVQYRSNNEGGFFDNVDIVLISATGATGKSALSHYLGATLQQPIYDMGEAGPVGDNSLIGMLSKNMAIAEMTAYLGDLSSGHSIMIIDALDEGALKVTSQALNSFYSEIARLANGKQGIPFVLTGRTQIMETATLELEERGLNVLLLQIEPFTIDQAKAFIDSSIQNKIGMDKHNTAYINVRDLIINSVEGFFQNINDMKQRQYERFIGYAPVLQTIVALLNENHNYQQLYNDLNSENKKNIALIIDIIEKILYREKGKVAKELLPQLTQNISPETIDFVKENAYNITEQCIRILCVVMGEEFHYPISNDKAFDIPYEDKIAEWQLEHPFFDKDKKTFVNVVFESYVIASLLHVEQYRQIALRYLHSSKYKTSYMFFDFYQSLNKGEKIVDIQIVPYLYDSLISMDSKADNVRMELSENEQQQMEVSFVRKDAEYMFPVLKTENQIFLPIYCSDIIVDAPIRVIIPFSTKIDMKAPISLFCKEILFESNELCLLENPSQQGGIVWEADSIVVNLPNGANPEIRDYIKNGTKFIINTQEKTSYPFIQYCSGEYNKDKEISTHNIFYQKLRRALLMFRSHSKGILARYKDKIDNRIGISVQGKQVITALKASGIMREDSIMYYLDNKKMADILGVKYDDIQAAVLNPQVNEFIHQIEVTKQVVDEK